MDLKHKPLTSGMVLLAATTFGHIANFFFQMIMGRMLKGEDFPEFGVLNTMLSIFGMFAIPASALQLSIARQTAIFDAQNDADSIAAILRRATRRLVSIGAVLVVALVALSPWLKDYLQLEQYEPIFVTIALLVVGIILPVGNGTLQGVKRFWWLSVGGVATPLVRIGLGVFLVWAGWGASGALMGTLAGNAVMLVVFGVVLGGYFRRTVAYQEIDTSVVYRYLGPTLISLICYAGLVNLDLVVVKHYFTPDQASQYAAASLFGRSIGWLISPLCAALFPYVWDETQHQANRALLVKFLLAALGLGIAACVVCTLGSGLLTTLLLGRTESTVTELIPLCVWAMLPIGVANVFLYFAMARGRYGFLTVFIGVTAAYLVAFVFWHNTIREILGVVASFGVVTLILFVGIVYGTRPALQPQ